MKFTSIPLRFRRSRARAVTLLLTLLVLVMAVTVLGRQVSQVTQERLSASSRSFATRSRWIAEGVASQWALRSQNPLVTFDDLLIAGDWTVDQPDGPLTHIRVWPTSSHNKLYLPSFTNEDVATFSAQEPSGVLLASDLDQRLLETGNAALEVILDSTYLTAKPAYRVAETRRGIDVAPADVMTVWGDGKIDLNRCPLDVMRAQLRGFTDAQLAGIIRHRGEKDGFKLSEELSLSEDQQHLMVNATTLHPTTIELVIQIQYGGLSTLYHAVINASSPGRVLEVRPIL